MIEMENKWQEYSVAEWLDVRRQRPLVWTLSRHIRPALTTKLKSFATFELVRHILRRVKTIGWTK